MRGSGLYREVGKSTFLPGRSQGRPPRGAAPPAFVRQGRGGAGGQGRNPTSRAASRRRGIPGQEERPAALAKRSGRALLEFCDPRPEWEVEGLNKEQLVEKLAARTGMTKRDAMDTLNTALDTVVASLKKGEKVTLVGFGTFLVRRRSPPAGGGSRSSSPSSLSSPSRYC